MNINVQNIDMDKVTEVVSKRGTIGICNQKFVQKFHVPFFAYCNTVDLQKMLSSFVTDR